MKINANVFKSFFNRACFGGVINEIVIGERGEVASIDSSKSIIVFNLTGLDGWDLGKIGIYDTPKFIKFIDFSSSSIFKSDDIDLKMKDVSVVFKKGSSMAKFITASTDVISSCIQNPKTVLDKLRAEDSIKVTISKENIDVVQSALKLIDSPSLKILIDDGLATIQIGKDTEHSTTLSFGTSKSKKKHSLCLEINNFSRLLSLVDITNESLAFEFRDGLPLIVVDGDFIFVQDPIEDNI